MKSLNLMTLQYPYLYTISISEAVAVPLGVVVASILGF